MNKENNVSYKVPFIMMVVLFFLFGFLTVLNQQLQTPLKAVFALSNTQSTLLTFAFFTAFVVTSTPASSIIDKVGYKKTLVVALLVVALALGSFFIAALQESFVIFVIGSFILGAGITMLQVVANPYIAALGSSDSAGSRINLAGAFNSLATFIAPNFAIYVMFMGKESKDVLIDDVKLPYVGLLIFAILLAGIFGMLKLPEIGAKKEEGAIPEKLEGNAWQFSHLTLGVLAIFCYVGAEVAVGSNLGSFLEASKMAPSLNIFGFELSKVSMYWGGLMIGRFLGSSLFKNVNEKSALVFVSIGSMVFTLAGAFLPAEISVYFLIAVGLFHSVMWGYIFGLAIFGLGKYTNQASGYLLMGVFGGAVVPMAQGFLADNLSNNWQITFAFVALCQAYLLYYALIGSKPKKVAA